MLGKLRATNNADIRRVLGMPSKEADRCVKEVPREKGSQRGYTDDDLEEAIKAHPGNALNAVIVLQQAPGCVVAFRKRLDFAAGMM